MSTNKGTAIKLQWDGAISEDARECDSIPERVTAVQARLQALLDDVKIMGIQLGAWERAMETADAPWHPYRDDAEAAVEATIEKLEKGTY